MAISERFTDDTNVYEALVGERVAEVRDRIAMARSRGGLGQDVTLIAVTKTHGPEAIVAAWKAGVADVGENKVQEAESKMTSVSVPVRWHLIGHLQRNKARSATQFALVHSLDSERLAASLSATAEASGRRLDVLVQVNVSQEATKYGFATEEIPALADRLHAWPHLRVMGAMTMAPFDAPEVVLRSVFVGVRAVQTQLRSAGHPATVLSMGMSGDYELAVEEGATHVRLGTILFGDRS